MTTNLNLSPEPGIVAFTCQCGRVLETMCAACSERSFVVASAKRRPELLARLDAIGWAAYVDYETALIYALRRLENAGTLCHMQWGRRGNIVRQEPGEPAERAPFDADDEDWFIAAGASWDPVFEFIDACYAKVRRARNVHERIDALLPASPVEARRLFDQNSGLLGLDAVRYEAKIRAAEARFVPVRVTVPIPDSPDPAPTPPEVMP